MVRAILATVLGGVAAVAVITGVELLGAALFPPPAGTEAGDLAGMRAAVAAMPLAAELLILAAWWLGAAVGGWVANRIGRVSWPALVVGVAVSASVVAEAIGLPHPPWMQLAGVLGPLAIGGALWRSRRPAVS